MFVRNFLQSGDYVTVVPAGLVGTLRYNGRGQLEKVLVGHENWKTDITSLVMPALLKRDLVPGMISIKNGTTYVRGVFYDQDILSSSKIPNEGQLSDCLNDYIIDRIMKLNLPDNTECPVEFLAGDLESNGASFSDILTMRRSLAIMHFQLLPGYLIGQDTTDEDFKKFVTMSKSPFEFEWISDLITIRRGQKIYCSSGRVLRKVSKYHKTVHDDGSIYVKDGTKEIPYSEACFRNLVPDGWVIEDELGHILFSSTQSNAELNSKLADPICEFCGKKIPIAKYPLPTKCDNPECPSILYKDVQHMLSALHLPELRRTTFLSFAKQRKNKISLLDVLDVDPYKNIQIEVTLSDLLRAAIPTTVVPQLQQLIDLCVECHNNRDTVIFYLENPSRFKTDLKLNISAYNNLFAWMQDPIMHGADRIEKFLTSVRFTIKESSKMFEGSPILRNVVAYLTGKFQHGDHYRISSIISSYAGSVSSKFDSSVNLVIVGELNEDIEGNIISHAVTSGVAVMKESEFFDRYDIDSDLSENL